MSEVMKLSEQMAKYQPGDVIRWTSQSAGTRVAKEGEIIGFVWPNEDLYDKIKKHSPNVRDSHIKASQVSFLLRYIIKVFPPAKKRPGVMRGYTDPAPVYYAPLVRTIDGDSASGGKLARKAGK